MKKRIHPQHPLTLAVVTLTLLAGPLMTTPARAQDAPAPSAITTPISLDLRQVPVQAALTALFKSAGIRNFNIEGQPQGFVNLSVNEVPFSVALQQLLNSANPPLVADVQGGIYVIHQQPVAPPPPSVPTVYAPPSPTVSTGTAVTDINAAKHFYTIPIDKYDAYYIASLLQATSGVIPVGVNDVVASGGGQGGFGQGQQAGQGQNGRQGGGFGQGQNGMGGQNGGFGGGQGGFGGGGYGGGGGGGFGGGGGGRGRRGGGG